MGSIEVTTSHHPYTGLGTDPSRTVPLSERAGVQRPDTEHPDASTAGGGGRIWSKKASCSGQEEQAEIIAILTMRYRELTEDAGSGFGSTRKATAKPGRQAIADMKNHPAINTADVEESANTTTRQGPQCPPGTVASRNAVPLADAVSTAGATDAGSGVPGQGGTGSRYFEKADPAELLPLLVNDRFASLPPGGADPLQKDQTVMQKSTFPWRTAAQVNARAGLAGTSQGGTYFFNRISAGRELSVSYDRLSATEPRLLLTASHSQLEERLQDSPGRHENWTFRRGDQDPQQKHRGQDPQPDAEEDQ